MEIIYLAVAVAFDFLIIKWKLKHKRYSDAALDAFIFGMICILFHGTMSGMAVGTIAGVIVSLYLLVYPPKLPAFNFNQDGEAIKLINDVFDINDTPKYQDPAWLTDYRARKGFI